MRYVAHHGLVEFQKSDLPSASKKRLRRGAFGTYYWIVPGGAAVERDPNGILYRFLDDTDAARQANASPWTQEIRFAINRFGKDLVDEYAFSISENRSQRFEDLEQDLRLELLEHQAKDSNSDLTNSSHVIQICKNKLLDIWAKITIESPSKSELPFTAKFRIRNWENRLADDPESDPPKYLKMDGMNSLDDPSPRTSDGDASYDENAEGASPMQRLIEGEIDDEVAHRGDLSSRKNAAEETMVEMLDVGGNTALLERAMPVLSEREQFAIRGWFGISDINLSKAQVADELGIKQDSAKKLVQRAMGKLLREMERQQDNDQRAYVGPQPSLPASYWSEFEKAQLKVWADLHITKQSYLRQLTLRARYADLAGVESDGAWTEPRSLFLADDLRTDARIVRLAGNSATWRECTNEECSHDVILAGRRRRIFLGTREKERGVAIPCPLCQILQTRGLAKQCPLYKTQGNLNTLCEGCFADSLPAEMARRRGDRVQAMPSNNGQPCWFVDIRTNQEPEIGLAHLEDHEDANGRVVIATDPVALPAIVLEDQEEVLAPVESTAVHTFGEQREAPAHLASMTPKEYLERQRLLSGNRLADKKAEVA
jgi:hypothetical protein